MTRKYREIMNMIESSPGPKLRCSNYSNTIYQKIISINVPRDKVVYHYMDEPDEPGKDLYAEYHRDTFTPDGLHLKESIPWRDNPAMDMATAFPTDVNNMTESQRETRMEEFRDLDLLAWSVKRALPQMEPDERRNACLQVINMWQASTMPSLSQTKGFCRPFEVMQTRIPELQEGLMDYISAGCKSYENMFSGDTPENIRSLADTFQEQAQRQVQSIMAIYDRDCSGLSEMQAQNVEEFMENMAQNAEDRYNREINTEEPAHNKSGIKFADFGIPMPPHGQEQFQNKSIPADWPGVRKLEQSRLAGTCCRDFDKQPGYNYLNHMDIVDEIRKYQGPRICRKNEFQDNIFQSIDHIDVPRTHTEYHYNQAMGMDPNQVLAIDKSDPQNIDKFEHVSFQSAFPSDPNHMSDTQKQDKIHDLSNIIIITAAAQRQFANMSDQQRQDVCTAIVDMWQAATMTDITKNNGCGRPFENMQARVGPLQYGLLNYIRAGCNAYIADYEGKNPEDARSLADKFQKAASEQAKATMELYDKDGYGLNLSETRYLNDFTDHLARSAKAHEYSNKNTDKKIKFQDFDIPMPKHAQPEFPKYQLNPNWAGVKKFEDTKLNSQPESESQESISHSRPRRTRRYVKTIPDGPSEKTGPSVQPRVLTKSQEQTQYEARQTLETQLFKYRGVVPTMSRAFQEDSIFKEYYGIEVPNGKDGYDVFDLDTKNPNAEKNLIAMYDEDLTNTKPGEKLKTRPVSLEQALPSDINAMTAEQKLTRQNQFENLKAQASLVQAALPNLSQEDRVRFCTHILEQWQAATLTEINADTLKGRPFENLQANIGPLQNGLLDYVQAGCDAYSAGFAGKSPEELEKLHKRFQISGERQAILTADLYNKDQSTFSVKEAKNLNEFKAFMDKKAENRLADYTKQPGNGAAIWKNDIPISDFGIPTPAGCPIRYQTDYLPHELPEAQALAQSGRTAAMARQFQESGSTPGPSRKPEPIRQSTRDMRDLEVACEEIQSQAGPADPNFDFE